MTRLIRLGRYRLGSLLGRGARGTVWNACDEELGRAVAVKEVQRDPAGHPGAGRAEARSAARIDHRGMVTVHDFVAQDSRKVDSAANAAEPPLPQTTGTPRELRLAVAVLDGEQQ